MTNIMRTVLRYFGGKYMLAPWIVEHLPPHRVYVEPYGGAASVLMRKPRSYAEVYNDLDGEVVNVFRVLRDRAGELERALRLTPFARAEFGAAYEPTDDVIEQARRTIIKSFMGHGSDGIHGAVGFRSNVTRDGSIPAHDWAAYPDALSAFCERLCGAVIERREAMGVIVQYDGPQSLFYVDPPYVMSTREGVDRYRHEMSDEQHRELAVLLHSVGGMVVLSGYRCELYDELYRDWMRVERDTYADGARPRVECLWLSPKACERRAPLFNWRDRV